MSPGAAASLALPRHEEAGGLAKVYVWDWSIRVTHWLTAASIVVLAVTGIYIGRPFLAPPAEGSLPQMGTLRLVHDVAAIVFAIAVSWRIAWMFLGNEYSRWDSFVPVRRERYSGILPTLQFYLLRLRKPPGFVGHNPLAGLAYGVIILVYLAMILTGVVLYAADRPGSWLGFFAGLSPLLGGLQAVRWTHHALMWVLLVFVVQHVYSSVLMSQVEQNATMESIFSGYKFVPREDVVSPRTGGSGGRG